MRFVDSRCIHCGATLRIANDATHICCQYCNSELLVVHEGDRATTELVREMQADLGQKLDVLRIQNDIERLDREWTMESQDYTVSDKNGVRSLPSVIGGIFIIVVGVVCGIYWISMANTNGVSGLVLAFGVLVVITIIASGYISIVKANAHESGETRYQSARRRLMNELARAQQKTAQPRS